MFQRHHSDNTRISTTEMKLSLDLKSGRLLSVEDVNKTKMIFLTRILSGCSQVDSDSSLKI